MSVDLRKLAELKETEAKESRRAEQAKGRIQELLSRLKKDFGVSSIELGEKELKKLRKEQERLEQEFTKGVENYEKEYSNGN